MVLYNYNSKNNYLPTTEGKNSFYCETSVLIVNLEKSIVFDGLVKELFNVKDLIRNDLQIEKQWLQRKVNDLENKVASIESKRN